MNRSEREERDRERRLAARNKLWHASNCKPRIYYSDPEEDPGSEEEDDNVTEDVGMDPFWQPACSSKHK
jgi:hypothetical protein